MSDTSPRLELPYIQAAQAQKHVTHNEALRVLDVLVQLTVEAFDATTPPPLPQEGAAFALGAGASGAWIGHDGDLAVFVDGYWDFYTPAQGWIATLAGSDTLRIWTGSAWEAPSIDQLDNLAKLGVNTTADTTNRLAVSSPATLFSHEGNDHRLKINKASTTDTASVLFQSNWSGRAEMGLSGSDAFSFKVSADGSTWHEALVIDPDTGRVTLADAELGSLNLPAAVASLAATATDVFVYDTSRDSDGGAWRDRCQHTSWYNEPLNTATRGAGRAFPAVAVIVAEAEKITIYDGDDPSLPMWRVEDYAGLSIRAVATFNGKIVVSASAGLIVSDYAGDDLGSTNFDYTTSTAPAIVNNSCYDAAITVLPGAPVSPGTGLAIPTIAVATGGDSTHLASIVQSSGAVYDIGADGGFSATWVTFRDDGALVLLRSDGTVFIWNDPGAIAADGTAPSATYSASSTPALFGTATGTAAGRAFGAPSGLALLQADPGAPANGMVARVTSSYATGWMPGDVKGAWLADTDTSSLVGGTVADRSVNANDLTVNGTVARAAVATGAEMVAYSGFSSGNYLEQPYSADLDFGTGDFCVMGWVKDTPGTVATDYLFDRRDVARTGAEIALFLQSSHKLGFFIGGAPLSSQSDIRADSWKFVVGMRASGVQYVFVDGELEASGASFNNVTNTNAPVFIGGASNNSSHLNTGSLALWRISASAPGSEQIRKIYEDEKVLFQPGATCTLHGASNAVTALAHDPATGLLHVGTSAGRSDFRGLRRVGSSTTAITTAIAASGGLIVEQ